MKMKFQTPLFFAIILFTLTSATGMSVAHADPASVRWTASEDKDSNFLHVIDVLNKRTNFQLLAADFLLIEDRELANNHFKFYVQIAANIPVNGRSLRIWTDSKTKDVIQVEALVENRQQLNKMKMQMGAILERLNQTSSLDDTKSIIEIAKNLIRRHTDDPKFHDLSQKRMWENGQLIDLITAKAKYGVHKIKIQVDSRKVLSQSYNNYPNADLGKDGGGNVIRPNFSELLNTNSNPDTDDEFSVPALVYPIYEEPRFGFLQSRVLAQLKHLKKSVKASGADIYAPLKIRQYLSNKHDPILGLTLQGQADGYWAMSDLRAKAAVIFNNLADVNNSFTEGGVTLEGRYASINIHPDALKAFSGINFAPKISTIFKPTWQPLNGDEDSEDAEVIPSSALLGRPLMFYEEAFERPARRLPEHNPAEYINDGFDEVQVYFAINTLMETLHNLGFTDPELSTRPFNAFLYVPDIGSRDNAFYTDDTINFTTYSPREQNMARDNSTIWHELGHGIMDRLMGDSVALADTGGLSEGMADFVASLVIEKITKGIPFDGADEFRIVNSIGFSMTNEVHDDGEAYGGSMRDLMVNARAKYGVDGVTKVGDLTMETMRLCRNNPAITAELWFSHMLFADELGHLPTRAPGELKDLILTSLAHRNFTLDGKNRAQFKVAYAGKELDAEGPGSRQKPIRLSLAPGQKSNYTLDVSVLDGISYKFKYPLKVRLQLQGGPLQGALHWDGEENKNIDYVLNGPDEKLSVNLSISDKCDYVNRPDGSCVDFAYLQILSDNQQIPVAKKRFYLRLMPSTR